VRPVLKSNCNSLGKLKSDAFIANSFLDPDVVNWIYRGYYLICFKKNRSIKNSNAIFVGYISLGAE
jgi:hypothetical protein